MVFAARLTQRGHKIHSMDDLLALYEKGYTSETVKRIVSLPHPAVQKFSVITVAVVGASRRFLAQITRHQNEVMGLLEVSISTAARVLKKLVKSNLLKQNGKGRGTNYIPL